jgi:hypothetical protein
MTQLVDDLDGSVAVATVSFSLDGRGYEIDLSEGHLAEFHSALDPFVTAARRVAGRGAEARRTARQGEAAADSADGRVVSSPVPAVNPVSAVKPVPAVSPVPAVVREAPAVAPTTSTQPFAPKPEPVRPEVASPRPERKRAPLVADPFNPQAQIG